MQPSRADEFTMATASQRSLTEVQQKQFQLAARHLQEGRQSEALRLAHELVRQVPAAPDAHQLLAMALSDSGAVAAAETAFRRALELAPGSSVVSANLSAFLKKNGRATEALQVLLAASESEQTLTQAGLLALQLHLPQEARRAFRRALELSPSSHVAWHGLGNAMRRLDDLPSAEQCFRKALQIAPDNARGWVNLGVVLRLSGRAEEALPCLDRAAQLGFSGPELPDARNVVLFDLGRVGEALMNARSLVQSHPAFVAGHETLVHLLWQHKAALLPGEDALDHLRRAISAQPDHRALALTYLQLLLSAKRPAAALELINTLRKTNREDPWLTWYAAESLNALGEHQSASNHFESAHRFFGDRSVAFLNAHARHAFQSQKFDLAYRCAADALRLSPHDQQALANMTICWRLMEDPREYWLCDYESMIGFVEVPTPRGFENSSAYLQALSSALDQLHLADREPLNQSVRHGSQTSGRLFGCREPIISATESAFTEAVRSWVSQLRIDAAHPFFSRRRGRLRIAGSWSVRLWSNGHHSNHIHPEGWISSAFYVALPGSTTSPAHESEQAGCIQFGAPVQDLGLDLSPRRTIRPKPGHLALFPSYFWHGTTPFSDDESRLTVAFDVQPAE